MDSNLKIFNNTEFGELGILVEDNKELFPATECARLLGYTNPQKAIRDHCRWCTKRSVGVLTGKRSDGTDAFQEVEMKFIPEGDLYRLITRSKLPSAERFESWIFDEVLPSIRKYGMFATDQLLDDMLKNPDYGIKLFTEYKVAREKARQLEIENAQSRQIIGELTPKASYYDLILQNKSLVAITQIAKDYGMSGRAMNALLHDLKIQYKMGNNWLLYQEYADKGYTQSKTHAIDADRSVMHTYWTQKGRLFLYDLLKNERGLLPVIERTQKSA